MYLKMKSIKILKDNLIDFVASTLPLAIRVILKRLTVFFFP